VNYISVAMPHSDQKYIQALVDNNELLLNELYDKFSCKIRRLIINNHGSEADAADIFQETLLTICQKAKGQNFVLTCPIDAFIYLVAKDKWINELAKRKSHKVTFIDSYGYDKIGEDTFKIAEEIVLERARKELIAAKVEELSESCKQLLKLSWEEKSLKEVAEILKLKYGYVRKKKSECMAKLIELVKQCPEFKSLKR
jgi:RNA polymerase sigma factor (sigma-70 family)